MESDQAGIRSTRSDAAASLGHSSRPGQITELLQEWSAGAPNALDELAPLVWPVLRVIARSRLRREQPGHTLQPTALVNEVFLRLMSQRQVQLNSRTEFFAFCAKLARRCLVDHYRERQRKKRGDGAVHVTLDDAVAVADAKSVDLLALDQALLRLEALDSRQLQVVEMRFFGGLTVEETARVIGCSKATVKREWRTAKAWLQHRLGAS